MLKEIQTAWLSEERKEGHSGGRAHGGKGTIVWAMVVLTRGTKRTCQSKERAPSGVVDVKLQTKGSECDPENIFERDPVWT